MNAPVRLDRHRLETALKGVPQDWQLFIDGAYRPALGGHVPHHTTQRYP